jgi:uncharacterized membrane protein YbjE (DUF340 family)
MGFRIGATTGSDKLAEIGGLSLVFAASTAAGTALVLAGIYSISRRLARLAENKAVPVSSGIQRPPRGAGKTETVSAGIKSLPALKEPLRLLIIVVAGFIAGWFVKIPGFSGEQVSSWMLRFLLFAIGIDMVKNGVSLKRAVAYPETLYLPAGVIAGSLLGSLVPALLFGIGAGKAMAVAAGFGWYSLSGVLITDMGDAVLGSAAFVSNILRETIALLTIPLISRSRFPHIGIGIAGATSMDVTLPLIEKSCGPDSVPLAITSGALLSLLVPLLVPLFYQL